MVVEVLISSGIGNMLNSPSLFRRDAVALKKYQKKWYLSKEHALEVHYCLKKKIKLKTPARAAHSFFFLLNSSPIGILSAIFFFCLQEELKNVIGLTWIKIHSILQDLYHNIKDETKQLRAVHHGLSCDRQ